MSSHQQEVFPTTSIDENCIDFQFPTERDYYVDLRQSLLGSKLKFVKGRCDETYNSKGVKKEHKEEFRAVVEMEEEQEVPIPLVTHANNILYSVFSNVEVWIKKQHIYNSNWLYAHKSYIFNSFKGAIFRGVSHCEGYCYEEFSEEIMEVPLSEPFSTKRMKMLSRNDGFMLYDFFCTSELLYPNLKTRIRLIRTWPKFYMISNNPNVTLGVFDCSLYTRRIALKFYYHKKRMGILANTPVEFNYMETLAKTIVIPVRQSQFFQKQLSNKAPVRRIAIAMKTNSA